MGIKRQLYLLRMRHRIADALRFDSFEAGHSWCISVWGEWQRNLTPDEARSFEHYSGNPGINMNRWLRGQKGSLAAEHQECCRRIVASIDKAPRVPQDLFVYRVFDATQRDKLLSSGGFRDKGFISTSIYPGLIEGASTGSVCAAILLPRGTRAVYINRLTPNCLRDDEAEVLIPPDVYALFYLRGKHLAGVKEVYELCVSKV